MSLLYHESGNAEIHKQSSCFFAHKKSGYRATFCGSIINVGMDDK